MVSLRFWPRFGDSLGIVIRIWQGLYEFLREFNDFLYGVVNGDVLPLGSIRIKGFPSGIQSGFDDFRKAFMIFLRIW